MDVAKDGYRDIHDHLQRRSEEIGESAMSPDYEPYSGRIRGLTIDAWMASPWVWRQRMLHYRDASSYIFASALCDKVVTLLSDTYHALPDNREVRRWHISETLLIKAECLVSVERL